VWLDAEVMFSVGSAGDVWGGAMGGEFVMVRVILSWPEFSLSI
jgi:hypothetical protein